MRKIDNKTSPNIVSLSANDHEFAVSRLDAERALKRDGYPSIDQIIERVKTKVDWPDNVWVELEAAANQSRNAPLRKDNDDIERRTILTRFWRNHRRLAMVCSVILIIGTTVAIVPETRAFAMQVCEAVMRIFGNRAGVQQPTQDYVEREYDSTIAEEFSALVDGDSVHESAPRVFADIQEFKDETGYTPFVLDSERFTYDAIRYIKNARNEKWLYIYYSYCDGTIATTQIWDSVDNIISTADDHFSEHLLSDGRIVYYTVDEIDESKYGMVMLADSVLIINSDAILSMDEFLSLFT